MQEETKRGRKPKDEVVREERMTIKLSVEEVERIDAMAKYVGIPKTVAARNMALMSLEEMESMKKYGILQIAKGIVRTSDWLKAFKKNKPVATLQDA